MRDHPNRRRPHALAAPLTVSPCIDPRVVVLALAAAAVLALAAVAHGQTSDRQAQAADDGESYATGPDWFLQPPRYEPRDLQQAGRVMQRIAEENRDSPIWDIEFGDGAAGGGDAQPAPREGQPQPTQQPFTRDAAQQPTSPQYRDESGRTLGQRLRDQQQRDRRGEPRRETRPRDRGGDRSTGPATLRGRVVAYDEIHGSADAVSTATLLVRDDDGRVHRAVFGNVQALRGGVTAGIRPDDQVFAMGDTEITAGRNVLDAQRLARGAGDRRPQPRGRFDEAARGVIDELVVLALDRGDQPSAAVGRVVDDNGYRDVLLGSPAALDRASTRLRPGDRVALDGWFNTVGGERLFIVRDAEVLAEPDRPHWLETRPGTERIDRTPEFNEYERALPPQRR